MAALGSDQSPTAKGPISESVVERDEPMAAAGFNDDRRRGLIAESSRED